jgi:hypothetical protein
MEDKITSYAMAKRTYDVDTETSFGDKLFSAMESKAQQVYEGFKGIQLGYAQAKLNSLESTTDSVKEVMGNEKIGDVATKAAWRNKVLEIDRDIVNSRKMMYSVSPTMQDTVGYKVIDTGVQYGTNLLMSLVPVVGNVMTSAEMATEILGGTFVSKLDQYKEEHPEDAELEGFKLESKDYAIATAKTAVNLFLEHKLGLFSQKKDVAEMFKKGLPKKGAARMAAKAYAKGAAKEFVTEGMQGTSDTAFDWVMGIVDGSEVKDNVIQSWKDAVYAGFWGGLLEGGGAVAARGRAIQNTKEAIRPNVESDEKAEVIATTVVDNLIEDTNSQIAVAAEISSQFKARRGDVYNSLYNAVYKAVTTAKAQGAYQEIAEDEVAEFVAAEAAQQADYAMSEAMKRKVPIQEVLDHTQIRYENGKIVLAEKKRDAQTLQQEYLQVAQRINEIDAQEAARGVPEYTAPTINVNGVDRQTANSAGTPIARSQKSLEYFYNWFGDSKVVDEQGRPLVMYHNTTKEFDAFSREKIGTSGTGAYHGYGFNFARSPHSEYGRVEIPVYLKASKPLSSEAKTITKQQLKELFMTLDEGVKDTLVGDFAYGYYPYGSTDYARHINEAVDNLYDGAESDLDIYAAFSMGSSSSSDKVIDAFSSLGYDSSVEYRDGKQSIVIVFNPNQIKSTSNEGSFSELTDNIYLQETTDTFPRVEMNAVTARDPERQNYMKEQMLKNGWTEEQAEAVVANLDKITDVIESIADKHPNLKEQLDRGEYVVFKPDFVKMVFEEEHLPLTIMSNKKTLGLLPRISAFKKNGDYTYNVDFGTTCTKREPLEAAVKMLIHEGFANKLGSSQLQAIKDILMNNGYEFPCRLCFVEGKRTKELNSAQRFSRHWNYVIDAAGIKGDQTIGESRTLTDEQVSKLEEIKSGKGYEKYIPDELKSGKEDKAKEGITKDRAKKVAARILEEYKKLGDGTSTLANRMTPDMLLNSEGTDYIFAKYADLAPALRGMIASRDGAGTAKPHESQNVYDTYSFKEMFDRKKNPEDIIKMLYNIGGVRMQSFTDFNVYMVLDYIQMLQDLAIRHMPAHAYTKVPSFVELFGEFLNINMSLIGGIERGVSEEYAGLRKAKEGEKVVLSDENGDWTYNWAVESFDPEKAFALRKEGRFKGKVGIIAVGISDKHIEALLNDPEIDMVIPFHKSGIESHILYSAGMQGAKDYSDTQNTGGLEYYVNGKKKKKKDYVFNKRVREIGNAKDTAKDYVAWCKKEGLTPKFEQFKDHPNYYKLLEDFRSYDNEGKPVMQEAVSIEVNNEFYSRLKTALEAQDELKYQIDRMSSNESLMQELRSNLKYERIDGELREVMLSKLEKALGSENVAILSQVDFLEELEKTNPEEAELFRNKTGALYGFTRDGKIYLNLSGFNAHTPAHEFSHVWDKVLQKVNKGLWDKGVELLKQTSEWKDVIADDMYKNIRENDNAVASEVLARIVGSMNEEIAREFQDPNKMRYKGNTLRDKIMQFISDMWSTIRSMFDPKYNGDDITSAREFARMTIQDLWDDGRAKQFRKSLETLTGSDTEFNSGDKYDQAARRSVSRGSITFGANKTWIKLTSEADATTLRHEFAHFWLDSVSKYALSGNASAEYVANWNKMAKYLNWHENMTRKEMEVAQEKFARSYEMYIKGGRYNGELEEMYKKYDKFLQRVYAKVTPQYKEDGKMVTPKLSEDAIEFFNNMTTVLPSVENVEDVSKEQTEQVINSKTFEPVVSMGESKESSVFKKHAMINGDEEILEYNVADLEEQNREAEKLVDRDPQAALDIMNVGGSNAVLTNAVFNAYIRRMREEGNNDAYLDALRKQSLYLTRLGQEIASQRGAIESIFNPAYWINKALVNKQQDLGVANLDAKIADKLAEGKTATQVAKEISEENGLKLFQKDSKINDTIEEVKELLGIKISKKEAQEIVNRTEALKKSAKKSDVTGNPTVQYFENQRNLDDYINMLAPSSDLKVFTGIVSRGSMLLSLKSPATNIVGNVVNSTIEAIRRRVVRVSSKKPVSDIVSKDLKDQYYRYANEVFNVSGMTISSMEKLRTNELLGEKFISADGKGFVQAWGRFMEKYVFKYLLGKADSITKNIAFVDAVSMEASGIALAKYKNMEKAKKKADDIFKDACLIEPKTRVGRKVRLKGIEEALIATFQQDTRVSKFVLQVREAVNERFAGIGDILAPFVKTPANIISTGLDASYGGLAAAIDILRRASKSGKIKVTDENKTKITRNAIGLAVAAAIAAMIDEDDYIPVYELCSPAERELVKNSGGVFNAVRIGGVWISLDYLAALGMPIVGFLQARRQRGIINRAFGYVAGTGLQVLNTPVVKEFKEYIESVSRNLKGDAAKAGEHVLKDTISEVYSRIVPSIISDIAKITDFKERDTSGSMLAPIQNKIPGLRNKLPVKQSILTGGDMEGENFLLELLAGSRVKVGSDNELIQNVRKAINEKFNITLSDPMKYGKLSTLSDENKELARIEFAEKFFEEASAVEFDNAEDFADKLNKIRRKITNSLKRKYLD